MVDPALAARQDRDHEHPGMREAEVCLGVIPDRSLLLSSIQPTSEARVPQAPAGGMERSKPLRRVI